MTSLQEKRRRYVAREIAAAAMRLFGDRGFEAVTVEEIAAAAGISARTFFRYYATKDEVVLQYHRRMQDRLVEALAARPEREGPITALRSAYLATSHVAPEDRESVLLTNRFLGASDDLRVRTQGLHTDGSRAIVSMIAGRMGVDPTSDSRPETVVVAMGAAAGAAFQRWISSGGEGDPADHIAAALALLQAGLDPLDRPRRRNRARSG